MELRQSLLHMVMSFWVLQESVKFRDRMGFLFLVKQEV
jgi:hypothetical protein